MHEPKEEGSAHLAVPGVYFTCPLTGAILRKDQRDARIREAILMVSARPAAGAAPRSLEGLAALQRHHLGVLRFCANLPHLWDRIHSLGG